MSAEKVFASLDLVETFLSPLFIPKKSAYPHFAPLFVFFQNLPIKISSAPVDGPDPGTQ